MSTRIRSLCAYVASALLIATALAENADAYEPTWGSHTSIRPSMMSTGWLEFNKLGPQPEPPDMPMSLRSWEEDDYAKLGPQPEPPDMPAFQFDILLMDYLGF